MTMYGNEIISFKPEVRSSELMRRSAIRAARRDDLAKRYDDLSDVLIATPMERKIITAVAEWATFDADGKTIVLRGPAECIASALVHAAPWPWRPDEDQAEARMWADRHDDLCAVRDIDVMADEPNPLHPAVAMRKSLIEALIWACDYM